MSEKSFGKKYPWSLDETSFAAVTPYHDPKAAAEYDARMKTIRDVSDENRRLLDILRRENAIGEDESILEIGTGTGAFPLAASPFYKEVLAVDVSDSMLAAAKNRAKQAGLTNIRFENAGFLSFDNTKPFAAAVSSLALHHINDVWKSEAVCRIYNALKPGGIFLLVDVVFDCQGGELDEYVKRTVPGTIDPGMKHDLYGHIAAESSTFRWIMDGIITRAGFEIIQFEKFSTVPHLYVCKK